MMLNQTNARQVKPILDDFFFRWPWPDSAALAEPDEMATMIRSLGLQNRRARSIIRMSREFCAGVPVEELHGIGKYALDSYRIFVKGELPGVDDVDDKELKNYLRWAHGS